LIDVDASWWQRGVIYQIYPRSFADATGDGIGDLIGIRQHLDHLSWLGVDGLWTSPIYPSPMADFGYDVSNYTEIDPVFGSLDDFDALVDAAHRRDLRVLLDWVPNHTSDRHPWFMASRGSRSNPYRDWYIWRDEPNNWRRAFADASAWTLDQRTGQYYLHHFLPQQPDLNWNNPAVRSAMHDVLRFWLDRGVDGFRADVVHLIGKNPDLPDDPPDHSGDRVGTHHDDLTHEWLRGIRKVLDSYDGDRMMVGEVNLHDPAEILSHAGTDQLHLVFNFGLLRTPWDAEAFRDEVAAIERHAQQTATWPTLVLSNHDEPRHRTRYGGDERRARVAAVVLLTLRGTPFLYAGEELGLEDAHVPPDRVVDPGGRDPCRAPIPWTAEPAHGWDGEPWLPFPPDPETRNVATQRRDPRSVANLYRRLLRTRRNDPALHSGELELLDAPAHVLAYDRVGPGSRRRVLANLGDAATAVDDVAGCEVLIATDRSAEGRPFTGELEPVSAVVLSDGVG
jgi:alpha-glucosidase